MYNYINIFAILLILYILIYITHKYFISSEQLNQNVSNYRTKYLDDQEETIYKTSINKNILIENFVNNTEDNIKNIINKYKLQDLDNKNIKENTKDEINNVKNVKPNISSLKTVTKQKLQCKFLNDCNDDYKFTGANIQLDSESGMLTCGDGSTLKKASAIASTNEEYYIDKIYITNQGSGYNQSPVVKIKSDVNDSSPIITTSIVKDGKLVNIIVPDNKKNIFIHH